MSRTFTVRRMDALIARLEEDPTANAAYRRLVRLNHADASGDPDEFLRVRDAYEMATRDADLRSGLVDGRSGQGEALRAIMCLADDGMGMDCR